VSFNSLCLLYNYDMIYQALMFDVFKSKLNQLFMRYLTLGTKDYSSKTMSLKEMDVIKNWNCYSMFNRNLYSYKIKEIYLLVSSQ